MWETSFSQDRLLRSSTIAKLPITKTVALSRETVKAIVDTTKKPTKQSNGSN